MCQKKKSFFLQPHSFIHSPTTVSAVASCGMQPLVSASSKHSAKTDYCKMLFVCLFCFFLNNKPQLLDQLAICFCGDLNRIFCKPRPGLQLLLQSQLTRNVFYMFKWLQRKEKDRQTKQWNKDKYVAEILCGLQNPKHRQEGLPPPAWIEGH